MNLYDQLLTLQILKDAFGEWSSYREHLTQYIIENAEGRECIAIFGAGRCNDIDLRQLAAHFNKVILLDKDLEAMEAAIAQYGLEGSSVIQMQEQDFVGISADAYREYADKLIMEIRKKGIHTNCHELARFTIGQLEQIDRQLMTSELELGEQIYDNVVVMGVHSQLISMLEWIWSIMLQTLNKEENSVRDHIAIMNQKVTERFNSALLKASKNIVMIGYEKQRVGREGAIQGALQARYDIQKRVEKGEIQLLDCLEILWPFDPKQGITYEMQIDKLKI